MPSIRWKLCLCFALLALRAGSAEPTPAFQVSDGQRRWWAFQPLKSAAVPRVTNTAWPRSDIDRFILVELGKRSIPLVAEADRRTLLRRVSFDLVGLPPTPEDVEAFQNDTSPNAFEKIVDRLLASPGYGERWARHWLDVVRYADYHDGNPKARNPVCEPLEAWRYRDWVVKSFNCDLPFDQFIVHQIAGDLLPPPAGHEVNSDGLIATTFLVNGAWDRGDADKEKMVSDMVDDQIDTIGKAFLGMTLGCARCHDHKFDPVSQVDYYALAGIFYSTRMLTELGTKGGEITLQRRPLAPQSLVDRRLQQVKHLTDLKAKLTALDKKPPLAEAIRPLLARQIDYLQKTLLHEIPMTLAVSEGGVPGGLFPKVQDVPVHIRGSYTRLGPVTPRGLPKFLAGKNASPVPAGSGRLELARWIASKDNALTARVIVNRIWQWHFGTGLVTTPNNFGLTSEPPSHPELLDWLAARFIDDGWSIKKLHRRIVLCATYQAAGPRPNDGEESQRWFGRFSSRRKEAETLRDAMLVVSGRLDRSMGGPATHDLALPRRSLYVQTARWDRSNFASLFDAANPDAAVEKRDVSTVAPQSLFLLNHSFVRTQATLFAERMTREHANRDQRIQAMFQQAFGRSATEREMLVAVRLVGAGSADAWRDLAHVLLCSNEFAYVD